MKVTKEDRAKRFSFMEDLLSGLVPPQQAVNRFRVEYKASERTALRYLALVRESWAKESEPTREAKRLEIERAADNAYRQAIALGEVSPAVSALRLKAQLHGLANRVEVTGANGKPLADEFAERLLRALENPDSATASTGALAKDQASTPETTAGGPPTATK